MTNDSMMDLPTGDHTPVKYQLPLPDWREISKRPLRRWLYPLLNAVRHGALATRYSTPDFQPDLWLLGQRGNDFERHRRRVNQLLSLQGRDVLIAGCGTGRDVDSWLHYNPRQVLACDWFRYDRAWDLWKNHFNKTAPSVQVDFIQGDLSNLKNIADASIDVIASDAVFEHLRNLHEVLQEFHRKLRPGGLVYATFGPLWYAWGGDHASGFDKLEHGYNHLILEKAQWEEYLDGMGEHNHSEHDGRTWIEHDLFSRLRPVEYLDLLDETGFERCFLGAIADPRGISCLQNEKLADCLLDNYAELDLLVTGMTVVYRKAR